MDGRINDFDPRDMIEWGFRRLEATEDLAQYHDLFQYVIDEKMDLLEIMAADRMQKSMIHDKVLTCDLIANTLFIAIYTFPDDIKVAKSSYYKEGYVSHLRKIISVAKSVNSGCHFFHIQFFRNETGFQIQITLWPEEGLLPFSPTFIVPWELLTFDESIKLGLENPAPETPDHHPGCNLQWLTSWWKRLRDVSFSLYYREEPDNIENF